MVDYGKVRSTVKPDPLVIDDFSVWESTDIQDVNEPGTEEMPGFVGYEYQLKQYEKDEFILAQAAQNETLSGEVTSLELAMCEIYETGI